MLNDFFKVMYAPEGTTGGDSSVTDNKGAGDKGKSDPNKPLTQEDINKMLDDKYKDRDLEWQKKFDTKNTEYQKTMKRLETLEKEKLSDDERKKLEDDEKNKTFLKKQKELEIKELRLNAKDWLKEKEINDVFVDFIMGEDESTTKDRIKNFKKIYDADLEKKVNEKLGSGYKPGNPPPNNTGVVNPWAKETFNLTMQGEILKKDPALAKQMQDSVKK